MDISQGQVGRLCTETNTFVVGAGVGELEFEADENELTLTVDDLVGEWAFFVPTGTGGAGGSNSTVAPAAPAAAAPAAGGDAAACDTICQILALLGVQQ